METLISLYRRALHLSPVAAQLSLRHMRRSPHVPTDLRLALFQVLLQQSAGFDRASVETWFEFQQGIDRGPPPGSAAGPTNEALGFVFLCRKYEGDGPPL
jgi:hypothetical protein